MSVEASQDEMKRGVNPSTPQPLNPTTPQRFDPSAHQPLDPLTPEPVNSSTLDAGLPGLNGSKRRPYQVTLEGWVALGLTGWVLASAVISHASLVLLVFCLLVALLAVGAFQTIRNLRQLEAARQLPDQAVAGRPFHIELAVRNRRLFGAAQGVVVTSQVAAGSQPLESQSAIFLPAVPARGQVSQRLEMLLPNRGVYRFSELGLSTKFPFGFLERNVVLGATQQLIVYPRIGKLSRRFFEFERDMHPHQEGRRPGPATLEADYHGLREFRDGDSPRWIHWATTARRGRLMVREFEARHNRDVAVLLDPWLPHPADPRDRDLLELAISFVATLCVELCERHSLHLVLGIAGNPTVVRHGQSSAGLLRELLEQLALVQGTNQTQWEALLNELPVAWTSQMHVTTVSPRSLDLLTRVGGSDATRRRWQNMARRLVEVYVGSGNLRDYFELH